MLHILVILIILIHFYLCFKSLAYGCAFYIAVKMIIPTPTRVAGLSLYTFMLVILIFFAMVRHMVWKSNTVCINGSFTLFFVNDCHKE